MSLLLKKLVLAVHGLLLYLALGKPELVRLINFYFLYNICIYIFLNFFLLRVWLNFIVFVDTDWILHAGGALNKNHYIGST